MRTGALPGPKNWIRDEGGMAIAMVTLLGTALIILTAVIVLRASTQTEASQQDREWEAALVSAETGLDETFTILSVNASFATVDSAETDLSSRAAIVAAAIAVAEEDPSQVRLGTDGETVIVKPAGEDTIYVVGFSPSIGHPTRSTRVVEASYELSPASPVTVPNWLSDVALLSGGDVHIEGNAEVQGENAGVHANGSLYAESIKIEGCGTEVVDSGYDPGAGCPPSPSLPRTVPIVDPLKVYDTSWYDMCLDGRLHYGPSYPDPAKANATGVPCGGDPVDSADGGNQGFTFNGTHTWSSTNKDTPEGVYFVVGDFNGRIGFDNLRPVSIYAATTDFQLGCAGPGGLISLDNQSSLSAHPDSGGIAIVAAGDIDFDGGVQVEGLILAHEQVDFKGNSSLVGAVVAEDACDSSGVQISTTDISGTATITWNGNAPTPFDAIDYAAGAGGDVTVTARREL